MSRRAARNVNLAAPLLLKMDEDTVSAIKVRENLIDRMEVAISNYLIKMTDQELGDDESHAVTELLNFVTEFERIGDYAVNIMEKAEELNEKEASFSESAQKELILLEKAVERILTVTGEAFEGDDTQKAMQVEPLEEVIDVMVERLRDQHIRRLKDGVCSIDTWGSHSWRPPRPDSPGRAPSRCNCGPQSCQSTSPSGRPPPPALQWGTAPRRSAGCGTAG